jgi:putative AlgH/UPF0301 family transcriptional regulator
MTQERVLRYLREHGERTAAGINLENLSNKGIAGILTKLFSTNKVTRREVWSKGKPVFAYMAVGSGPIEPEYSYILRNLPRHENTTSDSY